MISLWKYLLCKMRKVTGAWFVIYKTGDNIISPRREVKQLAQWTFHMPEKYRVVRKGSGQPVGFLCSAPAKPRSVEDVPEILIWKSLDEIRKGFTLSSEDFDPRKQ